MLEPPRTPFREKLGYYAMGLALGFCLLGLVLMNRANRERARLAEQAAEQAAQQTNPQPALPTR